MYEGDFNGHSLEHGQDFDPGVRAAHLVRLYQTHPSLLMNLVVICVKLIQGGLHAKEI